MEAVLCNQEENIALKMNEPCCFAYLRCRLPSLLRAPGSSSSLASLSAQSPHRYNKATLPSWPPTPVPNPSLMSHPSDWNELGILLGSESQSGACNRPGCPSCQNGLQLSTFCCKCCRWNSSGGTPSPLLSWPSQRQRFPSGILHISGRKTSYRCRMRANLQLDNILRRHISFPYRQPIDPSISHHFQTLAVDEIEPQIPPVSIQKCIMPHVINLCLDIERYVTCVL